MSPSLFLVDLKAEDFANSLFSPAKTQEAPKSLPAVGETRAQLHSALSAEQVFQGATDQLYCGDHELLFPNFFPQFQLFPLTQQKTVQELLDFYRNKAVLLKRDVSFLDRIQARATDDLGFNALEQHLNGATFWQLKALGIVHDEDWAMLLGIERAWIRKQKELEYQKAVNFLLDEDPDFLKALQNMATEEQFQQSIKNALRQILLQGDHKNGLSLLKNESPQERGYLLLKLAQRIVEEQPEFSVPGLGSSLPALFGVLRGYYAIDFDFTHLEQKSSFFVEEDGPAFDEPKGFDSD